MTNRINIIKIQCSFFVGVCVRRKYSYDQFNKKICSPVCVCVCVCVCTCWENLLNQCVHSWPKRIEIDFTYTYVYACVYIYMRDSKYGSFVL